MNNENQPEKKSPDTGALPGLMIQRHLNRISRALSSAVFHLYVLDRQLLLAGSEESDPKLPPVAKYFQKIAENSRIMNREQLRFPENRDDPDWNWSCTATLTAGSCTIQLQPPLTGPRNQQFRASLLFTDGQPIRTGNELTLHPLPQQEGRFVLDGIDPQQTPRLQFELKKADNPEPGKLITVLLHTEAEQSPDFRLALRQAAASGRLRVLLAALQQQPYPALEQWLKGLLLTAAAPDLRTRLRTAAAVRGSADNSADPELSADRTENPAEDPAAEILADIEALPDSGKADPLLTAADRLFSGEPGSRDAFTQTARESGCTELVQSALDPAVSAEELFNRATAYAFRLL